MVQRLSSRLARLEARAAQDKQSRSIVLRIGDPVQEDLNGNVRVIYLPRKSVSAEAWMCECTMRSQNGTV
jgi:hypothetical protein